MVKASVYIATSLDGYIARENGDLDWLPQGESAGSDGDYGYHDFMESVDVLVMGRHTYEQVRSFGQWPYGDKRVVVLSSQAIDIPRDIAKTVEVKSGTPLEVVNYLAEQGATHLYIDGGQTIQGFLKAGLIQQIIITTIPILIGGGIPLFGPLLKDIKLKHIETRSYESGFVQSKYEVVNKKGPSDAKHI